ncbi:hypothetical protein BLNAU_8489 [Blattamonas nauphoetae]|uniref:Uncharacterized protein n=1 Tax=Blattamonas nauphoetae TaxID=2049346 RepID=A0ABQ9XYV1_9EUKA|nr:hypothetical protein BLNAU_18226 [Blattamonas nauphoetae]KAK2956648.1 hypothetical protein BLNAU_8489 [Blattamonas nauphoetae]
MTLTMGGWTRDLAGRTQQRKLLAVRAQETEEEITQRVNEQRKQLQACHNKTLEKKYHNELLEASQKLDNTNEKGYMQLVPLTQLENEKTQKAKFGILIPKSLNLKRHNRSAKIERKLKIGKKMNQEAAILLQVLEGYMTNTFSHPYLNKKRKESKDKYKESIPPGNQFGGTSFGPDCKGKEDLKPSGEGSTLHRKTLSIIDANPLSLFTSSARAKKVL